MMDLKNARRYSDVLRPVVLHADQFDISGVQHRTREQYVSNGFIYGDGDRHISESPRVYSNFDHLDKTLLLENRMRIQENIINKHKTEAEKSRIKKRDGLNQENPKHPNDLNNKSYSGMFIKKSNRPNKSSEIHYRDSDMETVWIPKESSTDSRVNTLDYRITETLDTSRGRAKYALVRLNSAGHIDIPEVYVDNVHSFNPSHQPHINQQPRLLNGSKSHDILDKVIQNSDPRDIEKLNSEKKVKPNDNKKSTSKKSSQITLDDLNLPKDSKHHLMSRKPAQLQKTPNRSNGIDKINHQVLDQSMSSRRPSRDTNPTVSRKSTIINSRQSSQNWTKTSNSSSPISFNTTSSNKFSQEFKGGTAKKDYQQKGDNFRASNKTDEQSTVKKSENRKIKLPPNDIIKPDLTQNQRSQPKSMTTNRKTNNAGLSSKVEEKPQNKKNGKIPDKAKDLNSKSPFPEKQKQTGNLTNADTKRQSQQTGNATNAETKRQSHIPVKQTKKVNEQKTNYQPKQKPLRKTDSFKMVGNSSHFFGYCSVPEEEGKKPKSILKNSKPDRPDTA